MSEKIVQLNEEVIKGQIKELVRGSVEETLNELLEQEGLVTAEQGKGFYVNAQDSEMLIEQHLRKVEASLTEAIAAARIAGLSDDELKNMLDALLMVQD